MAKPENLIRHNCTCAWFLWEMVNGSGRVAPVPLINLLFGNQRAAQLSRSRFVNSYKVLLIEFTPLRNGARICFMYVLIVLDLNHGDNCAGNNWWLDHWNYQSVKLESARNAKRFVVINKGCIFYEESFCKNAPLLCRFKICVKN